MRKRTKILLGSIVLLAIFAIVFIQNTPQEEKEFIDDSIKARSGGAIRFNPLPEQTVQETNISQTNFTIEAREDGATLFIEDIPVANFSGYFVKDGLLWDLQFAMNVGNGNVTWEATDLGYNTSVWVTNESFDKLKFGSEYFGILPKDIEMIFQWAWYPDVETEFSEDSKIVRIKHPDFVGHHGDSAMYEINYYDLPENSVLSETEARTSFEDTTYFKIDPHAGNSCDTGNDATEDDFHDHCHQTVTDTTNTNECTGNFIDFAGGAGTLRGSFDSPRETINTVRTPISLNIQGDLNILAVSASCNVVIRSNQSCTSTVLINQTFQLNPADLAVQSQNSDFVNTTFLGRFGELCVELRANVADALGGGATAVTAGRIGIAPLLINQNLRNATINYFQDQTINHSLRQDEADNITEIWFRLINTSNLINIDGDLQDITPQNPFTHRLISFTTNPVPNTNLRYNYTNWTDNARNHSRFSTSSLDAITSPEPAGIWPKTPSFNLTNVISCSAFVSEDGISIYNKRESPDKSGWIQAFDGTNYNESTGVTSDFQYETSGSNTPQFSDAGFDLNSTGGWRRSNQITSTALAGDNRTGIPYEMNFTITNDADTAEIMKCTYLNTFNVSRIYQISSASGSVNNNTIQATSIVNRGHQQNVSGYIFRARGTALGALTDAFIVQVLDSNTQNIEQTVASEDTLSNGFLDVLFTHDSNDLTDTFTADTRRKFLRIVDDFGNYVSFNSTDAGTPNWNGTNISTYNLSERLQVSTLSGSIDQNSMVNWTPARVNRGEGVNWSAYLYLANGTKHASASSIDVFYVDNVSVSQVSTFAESTLSNGFIDVLMNLPTTATAVKTFLGTPYRVSLIDTNNNTLSYDQIVNGTRQGTFNVSSWYLLNHKDQKTPTVSPQYSNITFPDPNDADQISLVIGFETVYGFNEVINTRNESMASRIASAQAWFPNGTRYNGVLSVATADDGYTTTPLPVTAQAPVGFWTFGGNITHNGNSGEQNHSIKFQNGADSDPLRLSCDEPDVGGNITCILKSTELNGTPLTGLSPQINWTYPNQSSVVLNMVEIGNTGNYRARMNASVIGTYDILANVSIGGGVYWAGFSTFVNQIYSGGGGGGGLTAEQNETLYRTLRFAEQLLLNTTTIVNQNNDNSTTVMNNITIGLGVFNNSIIDVLRTWVGSQHVITRDYILNSSGGSGGLTALQNSTLFGIVANVTHNTTLEHWETRRNLTAQMGIFNESISNAVTGVRTTVNSIQTTVNSIQTTLSSLDTFLRTAWGDFTANSLRANITGNISSHHIITREYVLNSSSNVSGNVSVNATQVADAFCNRVQSVNATGFQRTVCYQINKTFINRGVGA